MRKNCKTCKHSRKEYFPKPGGPSLVYCMKRSHDVPTMYKCDEWEPEELEKRLERNKL